MKITVDRKLIERQSGTKQVFFILKSIFENKGKTRRTRRGRGTKSSNHEYWCYVMELKLVNYESNNKKNWIKKKLLNEVKSDANRLLFSEYRTLDWMFSFNTEPFHDENFNAFHFHSLLVVFFFLFELMKKFLITFHAVENCVCIIFGLDCLKICSILRIKLI